MRLVRGEFGGVPTRVRVSNVDYMSVRSTPYGGNGGCLVCFGWCRYYSLN